MYLWLREMKFGDSNTVAMLYDDFPIIDYFHYVNHYVNEDMVAGVMDSNKLNSYGVQLLPSETFLQGAVDTVDQY